MAGVIPAEFDFFFVDGDHSYEGLQMDWHIVLSRLVVGGVACFHDTTVPPEEPHRCPSSVRFFNEAIRAYPGFRLLETCYTLNVLERIEVP
jgi:hypothetical protein